METTNLLLEPLDPSKSEHIDEVFRIQSDPQTWTHLPAGCEQHVSQTEALVREHSQSWKAFGLGWWAVRLKESLPDCPTLPGTIIGLGGLGIRNPQLPVWNLGYRLTPEVWGHGLATELSAAGLQAAQKLDDRPIVARVLTGNPASWHVLEKLGLQLQWEGLGPATNPLTEGLQRRVYADRPLETELLERIIDLG